MAEAWAMRQVSEVRKSPIVAMNLIAEVTFWSAQWTIKVAGEVAV